MGWVVEDTSRPIYPRERDKAPIVQEGRCAPGPVWTGADNLSPPPPPPGFDPQTLQAAASRFTDYDIRAHDFLAYWFAYNISYKTVK
jgi:hypothetical protein